MVEKTKKKRKGSKGGKPRRDREACRNTKEPRERKCGKDAEGDTVASKPRKRRGGKKGKKEKVRKGKERKGSPMAGTQDDGAPRGKKNKELGARGEVAAERFLRRRGYEIIERNWTCFAGEADIIATNGEVLVFVEVKTRSGIRKGFPSEAVDRAKRERYERIALAYVQAHCIGEVMVRFDVIAIVVVAPDRALVRHHLGAFSAV